MIYNNAELDSMEGIDSYQKEPTWIDTFKASTKNFTSVSLSHSRDDYYKSEMKENATEWTAKDSGNKELYDRISNYAYKDMEQLEVLYDEGNIEAINNFRQVNPFNTDVFLAEDFLRYKELQTQQGLKPISEIREGINTKAIKDFEESSAILAQSDSLSAELAGTMFGALHDVKTLQTLPLGTWKTGGTVLANAGRAVAEEMGIEALAQISIAPEVYSFKKEIGLKTSVMTESYNAIASIATAGLVRGAGSAAFDLTEKGLKALRVKDPALADDYVELSKGQATEDLKTHVDNMNKVEFSGEPLDEVKMPNEKGIELNAAKDIPEADEFKVKQMSEEQDIQIVVDKDIEGEVVTRKYSEITKELDDNDNLFKQIEDCLLGVK